jgi:hypothetical protein
MIRTASLCRRSVLLKRALARHGVPLLPPQRMRQTLPEMMPPTGPLASPWAHDILLRLLEPHLLTSDPEPRHQTLQLKSP